MALKVSIVTPDADVLQVECDEVVVPGANGEIGFAPGHIAMITALKPGVLTIVKGGKKTYYAVASGFAEIENDVLSILTEAAEEASSIDVGRAKKSLTDAEDKLKGLNPEEPAHSEAWRRVERANARIDAAQRRA